MSNQITPAQAAESARKALAQIQAIFGDTSETFGDLTGGVVAGFPTISYRGKVWRIRKGGEETNYLNEEGEAVQSLDVVLVKAHNKPSKIFYDKAFEEGSVEAPRCWSANGDTPDIGVVNPIAANCAACPNNIWGSKINKDTGKKGRACADARRIAVVSMAELEEKGTEATKCLLRIPPASLVPLKEYAEKVLKPKGIPYFALVTRLGFDTEKAHPQITFKPKRFLTEDEARAILTIQASEEVKSMLAESTEFVGAAAAAATDDEPIQGVMPASMQAAAATAAPLVTPAPATVTAPPAAATPAATPPRASAAEAEMFPETPAEPPKKRGRPAGSTNKASPTAAAPAVAPVAAAPAAPSANSEPEAPSDFDDMLNKLLGS